MLVPALTYTQLPVGGGENRPGKLLSEDSYESGSAPQEAFDEAAFPSSLFQATTLAALSFAVALGISQMFKRKMNPLNAVQSLERRVLKRSNKYVLNPFKIW